MNRMTPKTEEYNILESTETETLLDLVNSLLEAGWKTRSEMFFHDGFFIQAMHKPAPRQFYIREGSGSPIDIRIAEDIVNLK